MSWQAFSAASIQNIALSVQIISKGNNFLNIEWPKKFKEYYLEPFFVSENTEQNYNGIGRKGCWDLSNISSGNYK